MKSPLTCFPNYKIQFGSSGSIWFIGALLVLMENDNINSFNGNYVIMKIVDKINEIMNINEVVLSYNPIKEKSIENFSYSHFISYKIALSSFINIDGIISKFLIKNYEFKNELIYYQNKFFISGKLIKEMKLNQEYYKLSGKDKIFEEDYYLNLIKLYNESKKLFVEYMDLKIKLGISYNSDQLISTNMTYDHYISKIKEIGTKLDSNLAQILKRKEKNYKLYTFEEFNRIFNDNNDIYVELLNN